MLYETLRTLAGANACVDDLPSASTPSQVMAGGIVIGWLEHASDLDLPGSYPSDQVGRLLAMPPGAQAPLVSKLIRELRSCHGVDLGPLR